MIASLFFVFLLQQRPANASVTSLIHDELFAIISNFAAIILVNYVFMSSAAAVFDNVGLIMPTFQDAFLLMDQVMSYLYGALFLHSFT